MTPKTSTTPTKVDLRRGRALTGPQRPLWASQHQYPDAPLQNMVEIIRIQGPVDGRRLADAFARVVEASDVLRTRVVLDDGEPRVLLTPAEGRSASDSLTEIVDLTPDEVDSWVRLRVQRPLDPSVRCHDSVLLQHPDGSATWYLGLHHLVTDATSSALVAELTARAYENPDRPVEVIPYYRWHDQREPGRRAERSRNYWGGRNAPSTIGAMYRGEHPPTPRSHRIPVPIDASLGSALATALEEHYRLLSSDLSWTALLSTVVASWAQRIAGVNHLSIGIPVHHRNERGAAAVIGPVMDVYPLDVEVDDDDTFATLHTRVGRRLLDLLKHSGPSGPPPGSDHRFIVNLLPDTDQQSFASMPAETEWIHTGYADPAHLARLQLTRFRGHPELAIDLNEAAAAPGQHDHVVGHLRRLLEAAVEDPDGRIGDVDLLDPEEKSLLRRWGTGSIATDHPLVTDALADALADGDEVVLIDEERTWTGEQLWSAVLATAARLAETGVRPGDRVAIDLPRSAEALVAILAVLEAGASFVPLDPDHPPARKNRLVERAGAVRTIDDPRMIVWGGDRPQPGRSSQRPTQADHEAYLLFTSGSTGEPKGVPIGHRGLADYVGFALSAYTGEEQPVSALFSALTFDLTLTSIFVPLLAGGRLVIIRGSGPDSIRRIATDETITWLKATPSHLELLLHHAASSGLRLRTLVVGGEAFGTALARRLHDRFEDASVFNEYGPTEAVVGCMIHRAERRPSVKRAEVPIGRPAPGVRLLVLDRHDRPVPIGVPGELHIHHRGVMAGYLDGDDEPFVTIDGLRYYRSGDLVRLVDDETLVYLGRLDEQLKIGGIRLDPSEIEAALVSHPGIERAVVRAWHPKPVPPRRHCIVCGLPDTVPGVAFDDEGICDTCHAYQRIAPQAEAWFRTVDDLREQLAVARKRRTGSYDAIHLLSGGKDSTYALYRLVELGFEVLALTLDNGFISEEAKANARRSVDELGVDHEFMTTDAMNDIFRDSLERHANVCHGCYKTIYTLATTRAVEVGAPLIVTGLSRGQLFETRLVPEQFEHDRFDPDAIDAATLQARRVYHRIDDGPRRLLDTRVFDDPEHDVFQRVEYLDFYRYENVELSEMLDFLEHRAPWVRPSDTGRSTNCLINAAGIHTHVNEQGYHNYAIPYAWDVRLGHKTRDEAMEELDDELDLDDVGEMLATVGYQPQTRQVLTAWIVPASDAAHGVLEAGALRNYLTGLLPSHALPSAFVVVDDIPMSSNGKVTVDRLPAPERRHRTSATVAVQAQTPLQSRIIEVWEQVLGTEPIGIDDDFFSLGGDSLRALRMVVRLGEELGAPLPEELAFTQSTPRLLADAIESGSRAGSPKARRHDQPPELGDAELGLLFEHRQAPTDPRYNIARVYHIDAPVDAERFRAAVETVASSHVPLHWTYGEPRRRLTGAEAVQADIHGSAVDRGAFRIAATAVQREPFDLEDGPLVRVLLRPLVDGGTGIALVAHHISIDAGTFDVLWDHIDRAYQGLSLPLPPYDHADLVAWQADVLVPADATFWARADLAAEPSGLDLRPAKATGPDGFVTRPTTITTRQIAATGLTPFAASLTALAATLRPRADGDRLPITIIASLQPRNDDTALIGYQLNLLPLVVETSPGGRLGELGARIGPLVREALAHRHYPFARITADRRRTGRPAPVPSVLLTLEDTSPARLGAAQASFEILDTGSTVADATIFVQTDSELIRLGLEYRGTVLDRSAADDLLADLERNLLDVVANPDRPIDTHLTRPSTQVGTAAAAATETRAEERFERAARRHPEATALECGSQIITYLQLERASNVLAHELKDQGVGRGTRVGIIATREAVTVAAILAVLKANAAYVPIDPEAPPHRRTLIESDAATATTLDPAASTLGDLFARTRDIADPGRPLVDRDGDDLAYVLYTSGSTGSPKGVMVTHGNLVASTAARDGVYPGPVGRFLLLSSLAFDSSVAGLYWTLSTGGTLVLPEPGRHLDIGHLGDLAVGTDDRAGATHLLALPSLYRTLLDERPGRGSLEVVIVAGEPCPANLVDRHLELRSGVGLWNEYGPTEATVWSHVFEVTDPSQPWSRVGDPGRGASVPIGRPIPGVHARVVDSDDQVVDAGRPGELLLGGPGISRGYLGDPDRTAESFIRPPSSDDPDDPDTLYRTGDRVRLLDSGDLEFLGRIDDQVKIRGHRVELGDIDAAAMAHHQVRQAAAVDTGAAPTTRLSLFFTGTAEPDELRSWLASLLPPAAVPTDLMVLETLPTTTTGKVDRNALRNRATMNATAGKGRADRASGTSPGTDQAELLAALWEAALGIDGVGAEDEFFALGGDSIMSMQIASRLRRHGWHLPPRAMVDHPRLADMAQQLVPLGPPDAEQGVLIGPVTPLPAQRWFLAQRFPEPHRWNQTRWLRLRDDDPEAWSRALLDVLVDVSTHHDALRLRWSADAGLRFAGEDAPTARLSTAGNAVDAAAEIAAMEEAFDLATGPIWGAIAFPQLEGGPQVYLSIHHLAIDLVSWAPLLDDWAWAAVQRRRGRRPRFGPKTSSVREWADRLALLPVAVTSEADVDDDPGTVAHRLTEAGTRRIERHIERSLLRLDDLDSKRLLDRIGTVVADAAAELLKGLVTEGHGRDLIDDGSIDISRTVGWFTVHRWFGNGELVDPDHGSPYPILWNHQGRTRSSSQIEDGSPFAGVGPVLPSISPMNHRAHRLGIESAEDETGLTLWFDHHPDDLPVAAVEDLVDRIVAALAADDGTPATADDPNRFDLVDWDDDDLDDLRSALGDLFDN